MKLEAGKIYLTRNGTQVGPMRPIEGEQFRGSLYAWGDDKHTRGYWNLYGQVYNNMEDPFDIMSGVYQETPQEDDEWGPWVVDFEDSLSPDAMIVEYVDGGDYLRHKVKKPVPKKQIEVGGKYTCGNGFYWVCIHISGNKAWMNQDDGETAYVWTLDGKSISLNETYNIDFSISPSADEEVPF